VDHTILTVFGSFFILVVIPVPFLNNKKLHSFYFQAKGLLQG